MYPEHIMYQAYTHLNFAFAFIDPITFEVASMGAKDELLYRRLVALKWWKPELEVWIAIGGMCTIFYSVSSAIQFANTSKAC